MSGHCNDCAKRVGDNWCIDPKYNSVMEQYAYMKCDGYQPILKKTASKIFEKPQKKLEENVEKEYENSPFGRFLQRGGFWCLNPDSNFWGKDLQ